MKQKTKKRIQGSISILLVTILLPTMVLSGLIVDTARLNMVRSMVSSSGDLALNSALANYDTILKDVYGLFAMSQAQTDDELAAEIKDYFANTLVSYGVTSEAEAGNYVDALMGDFKQYMAGVDSSIQPSNFLNMQVGDDFVVKKEASSGLDNPDIMRKQIVDYMKYRGPVNFGMGFFDSLAAFETIDDQTKVVTAQVEAQEELQPVTQGCRTAIDRIREYDKKVIAIDEGADAVLGLERSNDGQIVHIAQYHEQIDKYKSLWGEKYESINRYNLVFLLKSPQITDRFLSPLNYSAGEKFIADDCKSILSDNCGITAPFVLDEEYEAAANTTQSQKNILLSDPVLSIANTYANANFLSSSYLDTTNNIFTDRDGATLAFIRYEYFLLNSDGEVTVTYDAVKEVLQHIYVYNAFHSNQIGMLDSQINTKNQEVTAKEAEKTAKQGEKDAAQTAVTNAENAEAAAETAEDELDAAKTATENAKSALTTAENNLKAYTGSKISLTYLSLKNAVDSAKTAVTNAENAQSAAQTKYDEALAAVPTEEQMAALQATLATKTNELTTLTNEYNALVAELQALETTKETAVTDFAETVGKYKAFTDAYQEDLSLYETFKATATNMMEIEAKAVQAQFQKISGNVLALSQGLQQIEQDLVNLRTAITNYNTSVDAWETANNTYVSTNSSDSFSMQNAADIAATENQYNLASLETLIDYVISIFAEYDDFYVYIMDENRYKYGTVRIDQLFEGSAITGAVSVSVANSLPAVVTDSDADNAMASLYTDETTPSIEVDYPTFVTRQIVPIQFLKFLNENYPEQQQILDPQVDEEGNETSSAQEQYEQMREDMKTNEGGSDAIDSVDSNAYGYTFGSVTSLSTDTLPSHNRVSPQSVSTASATIPENDDGEVDAGAGLSSQTSALSSILGNVGAVIGTGVENIYIVDYIFENFSYNTLIQDMITKDKPLETYPQVINLATLEDLDTYLGTGKTLSNYNILGENNYLYGAEVEYILYGNVDPAKNIKYAKGSIYAIRFGFNCIFAFTDSQIRNMTMSAGLAVQAATMGFVPYQLVQIILQLALAAAESAIDLDMMSKGLDVVLVKTRDTWSLSLEGAANMIKETASEQVANMVEEGIVNAVEKVNKGINDVMNAASNELSGAITDLTDSVTTAAKGKAQEIVDSVYIEVQGLLDKALNDLQQIEYSTVENGVPIYMDRSEVETAVGDLFDDLRTNISRLQTQYEGNPIADKILERIIPNIIGSNGVVTTVENRVKEVIAKAYEQANLNNITEDIGSAICSEALKIKFEIINLIQNQIDNTGEQIEDTVLNTITETTGQLSQYAQECVVNEGERLSEAASAEIKEKIEETMDDFTEKYLKDVGDSVDIGAVDATPGRGDKLASMIKFGYKDYLMLFMFLSVCVSDEAVLCRVGDIIQLNMQHAGAATGSDVGDAVGGAATEASQTVTNALEEATEDKETPLLFEHKKGSNFKLSEAKTYVTVEGNVTVDMLFLDLDFFNRLFVEEGEDIQADLDAGTTLKYKGLAGY